jgi:hypothetical protein
MNNELKIVAINNVTFNPPLPSKKAFKKYKEIRKKEWVEELKNIIRDNETLDLIEDDANKREIRIDIGSGKTIFDVLGDLNKNDKEFYDED